MRKTATLLFCDLVDSTALGEALEGEATRHLMDRYFAAMSAAIERHGGTVEKFIGDAIMAAFGVPLLHEDDPLRAVRAAVEMRSALEEIGHEVMTLWGVGFSARIGINSGEVLVRDAAESHGFASGDAVNVAARLEQNARANQILIGESTYRQVRDAVTVAGPFAFDLKGKGEPVRAYELLEVMPEVAGLKRRLDTPLVGRGRELDDLTRAFDDCVRSRTSRLTTVLGGPGLGKSRLADSFTDSLGERALVLQGACPSYGDGITYLPLARAVRRAAGSTRSDGADVASAKLSRAMSGASEEADGGVINRLLSVLDVSDEPIPTNEVFWAARNFMEALAQQTPVVLLFDDIHWAESTLLDLIEYLSRFSTDVPVFLLCLARPSALDDRPGWARASELITLEPLGEHEIDALIEELVPGAALDASFRRKIVDVADGHPLYVEELVRTLIDDELLVHDGEGWQLKAEAVELVVPPTIHALVSARIDKLTSEQRSILEASAVIGRTFWLGAVDDLCDSPAQGTIGLLHELVAKDLVVPDISGLPGQDAFSFTHSMVCDVTYLGITKTRRAELHHAFALWLERWGTRLATGSELMAYHLEQAHHLRREVGIGDELTAELARKASELLSEQAKERFDCGDLPAAANCFDRAARLLPLDDPRRVDLLANHMVVLLETGEVEEAERTLHKLRVTAARCGDARSAAVCTLQDLTLRSLDDFTYWKKGALDELQELDTTFEDLGDHVLLSRTHQLIAEVHWDDHQNEGTQSALEIALEHAKAAEDRYSEGRILAWLATSLFWGPVPVKEAIPRCLEIASSAHDDLLVQARVMQSVAGLTAMNGDITSARRMIEQSRRAQRELGQGLNLATSTQFAGLLELMANDPEAAVDEFRSGLESLSEMGATSYLATQAALLARALYAADRWDEAMNLSEMSEEIGRDDRALLAEWGPTRARVLARRGDLDEACRIAVAAAGVALQGDDVFSTGNSLTAMTEVLLMAGRDEAAAAAARHAYETYRHKQIEPWARKLAPLADALGSRSTAETPADLSEFPKLVVRLGAKRDSVGAA